MKSKQITQPQLSTLLTQPLDQKIPALPLQFQHLPVELLSKEFTKLNNPHPYRIHYLGPRHIHTLAMHRRYGYNEEFKTEETKDDTNRAYPAPLRRIFNSNYMNERLRDNHHYRSSFFYRAFEGMNPTISQQEVSFNSAFQSGNLDCAIKVGPLEYDLFLRVDSNSRGHTNWFYFSVKNRKNTTEPLKFNICNLGRGPGLYDQGFRPFVRSSKAFDLRGQGWSQRGQDVSLQAVPMRYHLLGSKGHNFFRLSFSYRCQFEDDQIFFAYCAPYTYSDLHQDLLQWQKSKFLKKGILGRSLSGLQLPLLHITNHSAKGFNGYPKKNIIVTGRAHPAESSGSFMLRGFIQWLLGTSHEAAEVRDRINFFIIPMLNPDGVVLGNSRTSGAGKDLNRQFLATRKDLYPEVYHTKSLIAKIQKRHKVLVFLDFHGHSRRKNTFFYGPAYQICHRQYYRCRAFPKLIQKIAPQFRFYSCSFQISQAKRSAARAVALTQLKVPYAYTVQTSVGLYYDPLQMKTFNFTIQAWENMGKNIAIGLAQFILGLQELEVISRERKLQRQRIREGKFRQKGQKQHQITDKKEKKRFMLLDVIEEVKAIKNNFDDDIQSDDHDSAEDLEPYQLTEFNNLVIMGKQRQRKQERRVVEQQEENFEMPQQQDEQETEEVNPYQQITRQPSPPTRMTRSVEPKTAWSKILSTSDRKTRPKSILKKIEEEPQRIFTSNKQRDSKNFIKANRQRYSSGNLRLMGEDRCEIISLPKTPLIRRQKALHREEKHISEPLSRKGIRSIVDKLDMKIVRNNFMSIEPSLYQSLRGIELDNRAMTITTFKRK